MNRHQETKIKQEPGGTREGKSQHSKLFSRSNTQNLSTQNMHRRTTHMATRKTARVSLGGRETNPIDYVQLQKNINGFTAGTEGYSKVTYHEPGILFDRLGNSS
eukprot:snap_masked-scaffold_43-processed-gene-1.60-mRNA-1 protein AED:1.00 eAED:1.00 QI:0/-1/0/0/-1/1/1/0/103